MTPTAQDLPLQLNALPEAGAARLPAAGPRLAGEVGAQVAESLSMALARLEQWQQGGHAGAHGLEGVREAIQRARRVAMFGQQVSRLAAAPVAQAPERFELPMLWRHALRQRRAALAARGLEVRQRLRPAPVCVDANLMFALLEGLFDWAFEHCSGAALSVATELNTWPARAALRCGFDWRAPDRPEPGLDVGGEPAERSLDTLNWRLVEQAAAAMGVQLAREATATQVRLTLTFPEVTQQWPKLGELGVSDPVAAEAGAWGGRQVLVLAARAEMHHAARVGLKPLGAVLHAASDVDSARRASRQAVVQVLVADAATPGLDALCRELHAGASGPALVLVGGEGGGVVMRSDGRTEVTRVAPETLAQTLPAALRYILG